MYETDNFTHTLVQSWDCKPLLHTFLVLLEKIPRANSMGVYENHSFMLTTLSLFITSYQLCATPLSTLCNIFFFLHYFL